MRSACCHVNVRWIVLFQPSWLHFNTTKENPLRRIWSGSGLRIRIRIWDFLVQGYICDKIFMKIRSFSAEI